MNWNQNQNQNGRRGKRNNKTCSLSLKIGPKGTSTVLILSSCPDSEAVNGAPSLIPRIYFFHLRYRTDQVAPATKLLYRYLT
jgi:hypothetical protein